MRASVRQGARYVRI